MRPTQAAASATAMEILGGENLVLVVRASRVTAS